MSSDNGSYASGDGDIFAVIKKELYLRARNLKPGFFKNEILATLPFPTRYLFAGLWCLADREGRLEDRPKRIEGEIFPYEKMNVNRMLDLLAATNPPFISRYEIEGNRYIFICNFLNHQNPNPHEKKSVIPPCKCNANAKKCNAPLLPSSLNPPSPSSESPIPKTPSAKAATPFWQELIQHLNDSWSQKKRGAKYLWAGKDLSALKRVLTVYQPWDVMALWDIYLSSDDDFARRQGYNVPEFVRQLPRLVDGSWKFAAEKYRDKLMPPIKENVEKVGVLISGALAGKQIPK